jgi:hypothetical protein
MGVLRILLLPIFAAFLAGCAATTPLLPAPENVSTTIDEPDGSLAAEETSEAEKPKPLAPKSATESTTSHKDKMNSTTPTAGSPEWKKERAENERKERHLKQVIEGICSGC